MSHEFVLYPLGYENVSSSSGYVCGLLDTGFNVQILHRDQ